MNAEFEDHAERSYMKFVENNPALDEMPYAADCCAEYGEFATVGDVLRRIALDEREHKEESLERLTAPRFGLESGRRRWSLRSSKSAADNEKDGEEVAA